MKKIVILLFLVYINIFTKENTLLVKYRYNEPLLGKGNYLVLSDVPVATYPNTIGYFSNVEIEGKNLPVNKDVKKIVIKKNTEILFEKEVEWKEYMFLVEDLDLGGIKINLRWNAMTRQKIELMISEWDLEKNNYSIEIIYYYTDKKESLNLKIDMPEFNPDLYLNFDYKIPILKKQEYGKKYFVIKKISLNDYDLGITKNKINQHGLSLKINSEVKIKGKKGSEEYINFVKVYSLKEIYPNVLLENPEKNILNSSEEVLIGLELPKDLDFNSNYEIEGDVLTLSYGNITRSLINKILILNGKNEMSRVIVVNRWYKEKEKIYINSSEESSGYYHRNSEGEEFGRYKNLNLKVYEHLITIDKNGDSNEVNLEFGKLKVEDGKVWVSIHDFDAFKQGTEFSYVISDYKDTIIEDVKVIFYKEN